MNDDAKRVAAINVIMISKLYWFLVHDILLEPFYKTCRLFSSTFASNHDQVNVMSHMSAQTYPGIENIDSDPVRSLITSCSSLLLGQSDNSNVSK